MLYFHIVCFPLWHLIQWDVAITVWLCIHGNKLNHSLHMGINLSMMITGHSTLRSYYHRFKITDDPKCICKMGPQTTDHLLWECQLLRKQREVLKNSITKAGGDWPLTNSNLTNKHTKLFQMFVNSVNFETLWLVKSTILMFVQQ